MKKSLPFSNGFTLVELLVVIAIIAILTTIGVSIYAGAQKGVRDSRRKADVGAIASAYEQNYDPVKNKYKVLAKTDFQNGKFPTPPENPNSFYDGFNSEQYFDIATARGSSWMVCAQLEGRTTRCTKPTDPNCYCRSSTQGKTDIADISGFGSVLMPAPGGGAIPISSPIPTEGLVLWLRADDINSTDTTQVSSGNVIKWVASPFCCGKDAVKKGTYNAPTYVASQINGKPLVRFNGSQVLEVPSLTGNTFFTLIFVGRFVNLYPLSLGNPPWDNNAPNAGFYLSGNYIFDYQGITNSVQQSYIPPSNGNFPNWSANTIVTLAFNGRFFCYASLNSTNCVTSGSIITDASLTENFVIGGILSDSSTVCCWGTVDFAEIIVYNRPLVGSAALDSERNQVINYLKTKYGL